MDWLAKCQGEIKRKLTGKHLEDCGLALCDVSSSYVEGACNELASRGHSQDHRPDRPQVVYGLLCSREGCPVAISAFEGNTADHSTLAAQVTKLRDRFGLKRVSLKGFRHVTESAVLRVRRPPPFGQKLVVVSSAWRSVKSCVTARSSSAPILTPLVLTRSFSSERQYW